MAASSAAGSTLAISVAAPTTNDVTGFGALTFTDIGGLEKIGTIGVVFAKTEFQPFLGPKQKYKGAADYGSLQPSLAHDETDAGQSILRTAADDETNKLFAFALTYATGAKRYFQGRVFGYPETTDGADTVLTAAPTIEICTKVVKFTPGVTPAPAFSGNPTISPGSGDTSTTYTATDPTITNGTITARQWLLGPTVVGTGPTIVLGSGNTGQLTRKVIGTGTDGSTITATSTAVTVSAAVVTGPITFDPIVQRSGNVYTFTARRTVNIGNAETRTATVAASTLYPPGAVASDFGGTFPTGTINFAAGVATAPFTVTSPVAQPE